MFCKYKNIFGEVNKGVHSYRVFDIAIVDVIGTILIGILLNTLCPRYKLEHILIFLFLLGIIMHKIFCVNTKINKLIFKK